MARSSASEPRAAGRRHGARTLPDREVYQHDQQPLTFHRYDGLAFSANDQDAQVRLRREAQAGEALVAEGESTALGMSAAQVFELIGHPQSDLDGRYLIAEVTHTFEQSGVSYLNRFRCLPAEIPFRPQRQQPRPRIASVQTATVVGPAGEEIHTDEHGRVKVQLHWDRLGRFDEHSSCWIRVMQPWAGAGWGFVFIPRIGMEVIVSFVNGDPDRPLVIGSLYNGDHPPPYPLPEEKTKSTIKTNSSLGGGGSNELRFEDKKGDEEIYTHAEKDYNEVIEHDHATTVHRCQTNTVDVDQTETIHQDQRLIVDRHRFKRVIGNETTAVMGLRHEEVTGDKTVTLLSNRSLNIKLDDKTVVEGHRRLEVAQTLIEEIGTKAKLVAGDSIRLETGDSSITLLRNGTIVIKGIKLVLSGRDLIEAKGAKITEN